MNTLDDLRSSLDTYADRGEVHGADAVWAAASSAAAAGSPADGSDRVPRTRVPGSRRAIVVAAAAVILVVGIVGIVAAVRARDEVGVITSPTPDAVPEPVDAPPLPAIVVPDGEVRDVVVGFDRIWVATDSEPIPGAARLRSFDRETGEQTSDLPLAGTVQEVVATDESLFLRLGQVPDLPTRTDGERPWNAAVQRVDPSGRGVLDTVPLDEAGPIAASGSRVAFSDLSQLHLFDDATDTLNQIPIRDAVGHENHEITDADRSATFSFTGLALGPDGLFGKYAKGNELVQMDPTTGAHVASQFVEDGAEAIGPTLAASDGYLWSPGATTVYGVATPISTPPNLPAERRVGVGTSVSDLAALDGGRFVAVLSSQAVVGGDPGREDLRTTLDPAATGRIVADHGEPWVAQWNTFVEDPATVVSFVRVRTDATMPGGAPPATAPRPVLTVMASGPLVDGDAVPIAAAGLPAGAPVTFSVCLRGDTVDTGSCDHAVEPDPLPVERVGTLAGHGELFTNWTAQRSFYDDRWHDCAIEACVLRIYGVDDAGRRDTSTVLTETPITFSADGAPIRPTLTVAPNGPIRLGTAVTITGAQFPAGARGIDIGLCRTGPKDGSCRFDPSSMERTVDANGRLTVSFTVLPLDAGIVGVDPASAPPPVDCTAAPGTCSFSIFPMEGSGEPYATLAVDITS